MIGGIECPERRREKSKHSPAGEIHVVVSMSRPGRIIANSMPHL
jgi:hypothetical protein